MGATGYVLITPVRDEAATIGTTIDAVIEQTIRPKEWVIVSDRSTDGTDEIVRDYASRFEFIRLLPLNHARNRSFASVVFAVEAGISALNTGDYEFIGLLDGDIAFEPNYYEEILRRFANDPKLGLAGGLVIDCHRGRRRRNIQSLRDVAGAVQLFRRECFEALGGLKPLPEGGWDAITCVEARMQGFKTQTFRDIEVDHLKPRNVAEGNLFRRSWQLGIRAYALGNHPLFELVKCSYRCIEFPFVLGGCLRLGGFWWCYLSQRQRALSNETVRFIRQEQLRRLFGQSEPGLPFRNKSNA